MAVLVGLVHVKRSTSWLARLQEVSVTRSVTSVTQCYLRVTQCYLRVTHDKCNNVRVTGALAAAGANRRHTAARPARAGGQVSAEL